MDRLSTEPASFEVNLGPAFFALLACGNLLLFSQTQGGLTLLNTYCMMRKFQLCAECILTVYYIIGVPKTFPKWLCDEFHNGRNESQKSPSNTSVLHLNFLAWHKVCHIPQFSSFQEPLDQGIRDTKAIPYQTKHFANFVTKNDQIDFCSDRIRRIPLK